MPRQYDPKITARMKAFLEAPDNTRDFEEGARLLLIISGNKIRHAQFMRQGPDKFAAYITRRIRELYEFRIRDITHEQVTELRQKADAAVEDSEKKEQDYRSGRRPDHDSLPEEIQAAYTQTLDCIHHMRELHLKIRSLALADSPCADSEIYPFVKEIVKFDNRRLELWKKYDSFKNPQTS